MSSQAIKRDQNSQHLTLWKPSVTIHHLLFSIDKNIDKFSVRVPLNPEMNTVLHILYMTGLHRIEYIHTFIFPAAFRQPLMSSINNLAVRGVFLPRTQWLDGGAPRTLEAVNKLQLKRRDCWRNSCVTQICQHAERVSPVTARPSAELQTVTPAHHGLVCSELQTLCVNPVSQLHFVICKSKLMKKVRERPSSRGRL